jgi:hypothetical protein
MDAFSAFQVCQLAVAILLGEEKKRCLFRGWERVKKDRVDWSTSAFYLAPLGMIVLVLIGSTG